MNLISDIINVIALIIIFGVAFEGLKNYINKIRKNN